MSASRESLLALCLVVLALPFCTSSTSQTSQVHEAAESRGRMLRASNGRRLLQTARTTYAIFLGDADGGLTLGSVTTSSPNVSQVLGTTSAGFNSDLDSGYIDAFASNLDQTGCGVLQVTGTGSPRTSYVAFQNFTHVQPPNAYKTRDTNTRVDYSGFSGYTVGQTAAVGQSAVFARFPYPYSITPMTFNKDTVTQTTNISATFRPVGKACSSAAFVNDGQQASPVLLWVVGEDVLNRTTGGSLRRVLLANATCVSIKLDVRNAPTADQLNATVNLAIIAFAKLGGPGTALTQTLTTLQQPVAANNITSSYSAYYNNMDPGTVYNISASGSGPTQNALMVSVRVAMLTRKGADCGMQLRPDLSLAQPASTGK